MSLSDSLSLDNAAGTSATFDLLGRDLAGSKRIHNTTNLTEPIFLIIKHSTQQGGNVVVDRHLLSATMTVLDSAGKPVVAVVNFTIAAPRSSDLSYTDVKNLVGHMVNLVTDNQLTSGITTTVNLDKILLGES